MLILSRRKNEIIDLTLPDGRKIEIIVAEIRGDRCRIGIVAPREIPVHRREVQEVIDGKVQATVFGLLPVGE